jgi:hypothetical protein
MTHHPFFSLGAHQKKGHRYPAHIPLGHLKILLDPIVD